MSNLFKKHIPITKFLSDAPPHLPHHQNHHFMIGYIYRRK
jgi:hypothetical protein